MIIGVAVVIGLALWLLIAAHSSDLVVSDLPIGELESLKQTLSEHGIPTYLKHASAYVENLGLLQARPSLHVINSEQRVQAIDLLRSLKTVKWRVTSHGSGD